MELLYVSGGCYLDRVSNTASLTFGQPTHIVHQQQRWKAARAERKALIPPGTLLAKIVFCLSSSSPSLPSVCFLSCLVDEISDCIIDWSWFESCYQGKPQQELFFLWLRKRLRWCIRADGVDLSSQKKWNPTPPLHRLFGSSFIYVTVEDKINMFVCLSSLNLFPAQMFISDYDLFQSSKMTAVAVSTSSVPYDRINTNCNCFDNKLSDRIKRKYIQEGHSKSTGLHQAK